MLKRKLNVISELHQFKTETYIKKIHETFDPRKTRQVILDRENSLLITRSSWKKPKYLSLIFQESVFLTEFGLEFFFKSTQQIVNAE